MSAGESFCSRGEGQAAWGRWKLEGARLVGEHFLLTGERRHDRILHEARLTPGHRGETDADAVFVDDATADPCGQGQWPRFPWRVPFRAKCS